MIAPIYIPAFALFYIPFAIAFAWLNWYWIVKKRKSPKHFWNGLLHCVAAGIAFWLAGWKAGVAVLFIARLVFDTALNLFRSLPVDYVSPEVRGYTGLRMAIQKGKVIDYIEWKLFKNALVPKIIYAGVIIALLVA